MLEKRLIANVAVGLLILFALWLFTLKKPRQLSPAGPLPCTERMGVQRVRRSFCAASRR
jgi:hypothetical protein